MTAYLIGSAAGWIAVIVTGFEILLPYLMRRVSTSPPPALSQIAASTYLERMGPHFWLGYLLVAVSLVHTSAVMGDPLGHTNPEGIWAATGALLVLFLQVSFGIYLQSSSAPRRRFVKRCHFWGMVAIAAFLVLHVALNAA
ncbi:MAG TPA: hypothetical protein VEU11_12470 [Terriglobales bacterium]|jgi:cytochrome b561|nr:hypothetical protein [Terriglobales bacterium]